MFFLIKMYFIIYLHVFVHELSHYISAQIMNIRVERIKIGSRLGQISIGKWDISLICGGGYVEVYHEDIVNKSRKEIVFFFLAGMIGNLIVILTGEIVLNSLYRFLNFIIGVCFIVMNSIPFYKESDANNIIKVLTAKK